MKRSSGIRQQISKRSNVETEEERAENRALWNTGRNGSRRREMRIYRNRMRAVVKIRRKKRKNRTRNTKVGREYTYTLVLITDRSTAIHLSNWLFIIIIIIVLRPFSTQKRGLDDTN